MSPRPCRRCASPPRSATPDELGGHSRWRRAAAENRLRQLAASLVRRVTEALVGLGGNVGDVQATVSAAIDMFCDAREVRLIARSSDYRTPPWGVTDQASFVNACIAVDTTLTPRELLARALAVERAFGRERAREQRWGPRTIDIDLITYDDLVIDEPQLVLPHPRLFERAFVLVPLAEIVPDRMIAGTRVGDALDRIDTGGIEQLAKFSPRARD